MFSLVIPVIFLVCCLVAMYIRPSSGRHTCPRRIHNILHVRRILRISTLESRAIPNKRLVAAFGINNAFTTTDVDYHRAFVSKAKELIRTKDHGWVELSNTAQNIADSTLNPLREDSGILTLPLIRLVQSLVFRIVVMNFFPGSDMPSDEDVGFITAKINSLWLASKACSGDDTVKLFNDKEQLISKLNSFTRPRAGFQQLEQTTDKDNPLNWILPAYETLWRVVLHCFLEVRFRAKPSDALVYKSVIDQFLNQPSQQIFEIPLPSSAVTVRHIVDETLRLYPPTRRINRQLSDELVAIDIEHIHRDPIKWGDDALEFRPARWEEKNFDKMAFKPFGMGKFECPAKNSFGPMMIGVLVGALLSGIDEDFELCVDGVGGDVLGSGPLEGGREAHVGLELRLAKDDGILLL
ncbi:hypothetical protein ONS95_007178 [Cadophora gregata]|uniref:uncharacterized protein n=1 Tax=Cadophora gregata TaxID=51156 RepID=UPI0026DB184D|nr:uncharacterized protein ONS95_007178 [Cadophora gregata]KAK0100727.1 hypothetical protein ONS95_007178 [Cadophora gregata]KAK0117276.1 hypothetical protein ONS96_013109 [Cadophora gregata f. sp. sojae]